MGFKQRSPLPIIEGGTNTQSFVHAFGVAYYDGAALNNIDPGTSGYVLTSNGNSGAASFQAVSASGAITTINGNSGSVTPSAGAVTISGDGTVLSTSGSGSTLSVTSTAARVFHSGTGDATASSNAITITGTGVISTTATSATLTIASSAANVIHSSSGDATASSNAFTIVGSGTVSTSASGSTLTITGSGGGGGITWNDQTTTSVTMAVNNAYSANNAGLVTLTLPAAAVFGSVVQVSGNGAGGWSIAQNSGQTIHFGSVNTTAGVGGSLASTNRYDQVTLVCSVANTDWVVNSSFGNLTYV